jgi:hypothetical protein
VALHCTAWSMWIMEPIIDRVSSSGRASKGIGPTLHTWPHRTWIPPACRGIALHCTVDVDDGTNHRSSVLDPSSASTVRVTVSSARLSARSYIRGLTERENGRPTVLARARPGPGGHVETDIHKLDRGFVRTVLGVLRYLQDGGRVYTYCIVSQIAPDQSHAAVGAHALRSRSTNLALPSLSPHCIACLVRVGNNGASAFFLTQNGVVI